MAVAEVESPLILLVGSRQDELAQAREALRKEGYLTALASSCEAALHLLTQVRVTGCIALEPLPEGDAEDLRRSLDQWDLGCPKLWCTTPGKEALDEWTAVDRGRLLAAVRREFPVPVLTR
jgi:CheY-like chemotaxis protein